MMRKLKIGAYFLVWLGLSLLIPSCYEPTEGCLDTRATNFDLDADESCPGCCTYPTFKLEMDHVWAYPDETVSFRLDTFYIDAAGHPFRIHKIRYYFSEIYLQTAAGILPTSDSVTAFFPQINDTISQNILDNFALIEAKTTNSTHTIGMIQPAGSVNGLQYYFGIQAPINTALESGFSSSHPLAPQLGGMNLGGEEGYTFAKIELFKDTISTDTVPLVLHINGTDALRMLDLNFDPPAALFEAQNPTMVMEVNYQKWLEGIDVRNPDTTAIKQQIVLNLAQSFQLLELKSN